MAKGFLPYALDQRLRLPSDLREWLPDGHLALFRSDVVEALDLTPVRKAREKDEDRGRSGQRLKIFRNKRRLAAA